MSHTPESLARLMHAAFIDWVSLAGRQSGEVPDSFEDLRPRTLAAYLHVADSLLSVFSPRPDTLYAIRRLARDAQGRFNALARKDAA